MRLLPVLGTAIVLALSLALSTGAPGEAAGVAVQEPLYRQGAAATALVPIPLAPPPLPALTQVPLFQANFPVSLAVAPDNRVFFTELRTGKIGIYKDGQLLPQPFATLDLPGLRQGVGLLGIALDRNFAVDPLVYVVRTTCAEPSKQCTTPQSKIRNQVVRLRAQGDIAIEKSVVVNFPAALVHNAGGIAFGLDDKMYVTLGDGNVPNNAQDRRVLFGKILRYNKDGAIPASNPFPRSPIFAYGFRNAFDIAIDPFTGNLLATENGPDKWDEVNLVRRGGNYGSPRYRGVVKKKGYVDPIWVTEKTIGPTGITVYQGDRIPWLKGAVLWCDVNTSSLRAAFFQDRARTRLGPAQRIGHCMLDVAEGPDGALYVSDATTVYRIS